MTQPTIGFAGMTHLGLNSAVAAAERGFPTLCFDPDAGLSARLSRGELPIVEPDLPELLAKNAERLEFTSESGALRACDVVYVAPDVATDDSGVSDLSDLERLLGLVEPAMRADSVLVILSQVPPGFTRAFGRAGKPLVYQVETLIFGRAIERALHPERYIIGLADPQAPLPEAYRAFLEAHGCPLLPMRYESAELAKIAINCCLVASISVANTLAELCEGIGADWGEIAPALKLDRRIGAHAYLSPGLGIAGGNLERDLATVCRLADDVGGDAGVVRAWIANSGHRKLAAARMLERLLPAGGAGGEQAPLVAIWGLAYKENTHSTKNSPALATIAALPQYPIRFHDPVVEASAVQHPRAEAARTPLEAAADAQALLILTPWADYRAVAPADLARAMKGDLVIDPFRVLDEDRCAEAGLTRVTLGRSAEI
ncbi:MAG: hypothetical protein MI920_11695 [Kiloniellales bacterium]|nr:hypothetical protein [Kiloniellales bacterium]